MGCVRERKLYMSQQQQYDAEFHLERCERLFN
jgi:transcription initiation factor IIE alpha subunit